ncbi:MAG: ABC transporter permease [Pyrinomonadaceae bacterium]
MEHTTTGHNEILIDAEATATEVSLTEIWRFRELLYFLTWRDIKIRYKQTAVGAAWAIIQPLFAMLLFTLFFGKLARIPSDNVPYPLFAYAGLLPWTFFANAVTNSSNSLVGSSSLITKVYFPRLIIPIATVAAALVDLAIAFVLLIPLLFYYRVAPGPSIVVLPVFIVLTTLLAIAVGLLSAALNVRYRDVRYALPFLIQMWLFASPVIYPLSMLPRRWRWVLSLNPMTGFIEGFRSSLFSGGFDLRAVTIGTFLTLVFLAIALLVFRRVENSFADVI